MLKLIYHQKNDKTQKHKNTKIMLDNIKINMYECQPCNFISHIKTLTLRYKHHLLTPKHKSKLNTIPSQEDLNLLDRRIEKRQSLLNNLYSVCSKCHTSNVSSYHLSSVRDASFCAKKIQYAQDLIKKFDGNITVDELLKEFHHTSTIKAFALACQNSKRFTGSQPTTSSSPEPVEIHSPVAKILIEIPVGILLQEEPHPSISLTLTPASGFDIVKKAPLSVKKETLTSVSGSVTRSVTGGWKKTVIKRDTDTVPTGVTRGNGKKRTC